MCKQSCFHDLVSCSKDERREHAKTACLFRWKTGRKEIFHPTCETMIPLSMTGTISPVHPGEGGWWYQACLSSPKCWNSLLRTLHQNLLWMMQAWEDAALKLKSKIQPNKVGVCTRITGCVRWGESCKANPAPSISKLHHCHSDSETMVTCVQGELFQDYLLSLLSRHFGDLCTKLSLALKHNTQLASKWRICPEWWMVAPSGSENMPPWTILCLSPFVVLSSHILHLQTNHCPNKRTGALCQFPAAENENWYPEAERTCGGCKALQHIQCPVFSGSLDLVFELFMVLCLVLFLGRQASNPLLKNGIILAQIAFVG